MLLDRLSPEGAVGRRQHPHPAHRDLCWTAPAALCQLCLHSWLTTALLPALLRPPSSSLLLPQPHEPELRLWVPIPVPQCPLCQEGMEPPAPLSLRRGLEGGSAWHEAT